MGFEALRDEDLAELTAINTCYLEFVSSGDRCAGRQLARLEPAVRERLRRLDADQRRIVAGCPFLLGSIRDVEPDGSVCDTGTLELFRGAAAAGEFVLYMSLSLVCRIARRRPFAARLLAGVDRDWCEHIVGLDRPALAAIARAQSGRLQPVHAEIPGYWRELLQSAELTPLRRRAIRAAGLQLLQQPAEPVHLRAAASRLQVARRRTS